MQISGDKVIRTRLLKFYNLCIIIQYTIVYRALDYSMDLLINVAGLLIAPRR